MAQTKKAKVNWNPYQQTIFDWVAHGSGHALVSAAAGSGKTTTICGIVEQIPSQQKIAVLAFNRHMAEELQRRLPKRVTVSTIHRMGMYMLCRRFNTRNLSCNESKVPDLIRQALEDLRPDLHQSGYPKPRELEQEVRSFLKELIHYLQITLTEPNEVGIRWLIQHYTLDAPPEAVLKVLLPWPAKLLAKAQHQATHQLNISLDDLIWLPHVLNLHPIVKDWVLVDEAQDLSRAQFELVGKLPSDTGRMVFVGDPHQAIFGFAGSDDQSWQRIRESIQPTEFPLSLTYRCPKAHVELAAKIVPKIEARAEAPEGEVQVIPPGEIKHQVQLGDLILCRFTAPLISLCLKLVVYHQIPARVRGKEVGKLLSGLARTVADKFPRDFLIELSAYVDNKVEQYRQEGRESAVDALRDRANALEVCFETFGLKSETLEEFCHRIQGLFDDEAAQSEHVILATIHTAKGGEADRVFLLKSDSMPTLALAGNEWQQQQEWNLLYVALTRSKDKLFLVPIPRKSEELPSLLKDPAGGIQFTQLPPAIPTPTLKSEDRDQPKPSTKDPPSDFEHEVDALHRVTRQLLMELIETVQVYQAEFPEHMKVVWQWLRQDPSLLQPGIPLIWKPPQPKPQRAPQIRAAPLLKVGDICRYRGPKGSMNVTCAGRELQVLAVNQEVATVKADKWTQPYDIEIRYLRKSP